MKVLTTIAAVCLWAAPSLAADPAAHSLADIEAAVAAMFKAAPAEWQARTHPDETQRICSDTRNAPGGAQAGEIKARETASIAYPPDGNVMGDWKKGERIAQSGAGGQFSDGPETVRGANCYACHQMAPAEISHGTLGPSLSGYGKSRNFTAADTRAAYAKIFNSQSVLPCSTMPRFGYNKFLTVEQIADVTAYLMSPDSPVNK